MTHDSIPCITILTTDQMQDWMDGNLAGRGEEHFRRLADFWRDTEQAERVIWAAWWESGQLLGQESNEQKTLIGQITVQHHSHYPPFGRNGIFEIVDLWVHKDARNQGIGRKLLESAIDYARQQHCSAIGLGVGITHDFGAAQRLYISAGFMPDGTGIWAHGHQLRQGDKLTLDDGVIMMWVKQL